MWANLVTGRSTVAGISLLLLAASHYYSYSHGVQQGYQQGLRQRDHEDDARLFACQQTQQRLFSAEKERLVSLLAEQQRQVQRAQQTATDYQQQLQTLHARYQQLKRQQHAITTHFLDAKGQLHPLPTGFTRGFLQQANAAFGLPPDSGTDTASAQSASGGVSPSDTRLRLSALTQQDLLAWLLDIGQQCQALKAQVNGLLDQENKEHHAP